QAPFGRRVGIIQASLASAHHWLQNSRYTSPRVETLTYATDITFKIISTNDIVPFPMAQY
ncbi:MAG: hypothetical protein SPK61_06170, partial [Bacteroidales bacterium]|nr:hypothetical protein [Bacteroidales bacterium]